MGRKHKVAHHQTSIIHMGGPVLLCKHDQHHRRSIEGIKALLPTANLPVQALWDTAPVRLLDKTVHNPAQSGLKEGAARRDNVRGVYRAADPDGTRGRRILLVDDICTTGATLAECARVLREAGAADVVCAAAALTPLRAEKAAPDAKKG